MTHAVRLQSGFAWRETTSSCTEHAHVRVWQLISLDEPHGVLSGLGEARPVVTGRRTDREKLRTNGTVPTSAFSFGREHLIFGSLAIGC